VTRTALLGILLLSSTATTSQTPPPFRVEEASISDIHAALEAGRVTCRGLVEQYLRRIDTFDKNGPGINAIVLTNPEALAQADALDARAKQAGVAGPSIASR
jgi:amidase